jgi:hypothetical protein
MHKKRDEIYEKPSFGMIQAHAVRRRKLQSQT